MTGEWIGDWHLGPGRLVVAGRFGSTQPHHHPAVQVTVALTGEFVASDGRDSRTCRAVLIPSGVRHALAPAADTTRALSIYLHPATGCPPTDRPRGRRPRRLERRCRSRRPVSMTTCRWRP
ncbi:hypothetical protein [Nocardia sp. NPDC004415]